MGIFSRRRPAVCVVVAEAVFDGELRLSPVEVGDVKVDADHDLILQVHYRVIDKPGEEHWRIQFRAGLGPEGDATGPAVFDLMDRHHRIDSGQGLLEQRLRIPRGRHQVSFLVEAYYRVEPWDQDVLDAEAQKDRIEGTVRAIV